MTNEKKEILASDGNKKNKKSKAGGLAAISFFIALFDNIGSAFYNALINSFFGKILSSYSKLQNKFSKGFCGGYLLGGNKVRGILHKIKVFVATRIETGFFIDKTIKSMKYVCSLPLSSYGSFFLFFGVYTALTYFLKLIIPQLGAADIDYLFIGIITSIVSIPMTLSKQTVANCVKKSVIGNMIFQGAFDISDESFRRGIKRGIKKGNIMLFLGLVAGICTLFVHPLSIFLGILAIILICLIATAPEIGVLLSIVMVPFLHFVKYPTVYLCIFILITAFFYLLKVIRGKRLFKIEILDAFVLLFGFLIFCSGFFSAGNTISFGSIIVVCSLMLGYFLLVNLLRTEKWIKRCVLALVGSAAISSFVGIFEYIFGENSSQWLDISLFSDIKLRVVGWFENPNVLSTFIVLAFPFALALYVLSKKKNEKLLMFFVCMAMILCTVFTWSRGAWLAILIGSLVFGIFCSRKTFRFFGALVLMIPLAPIILPSTVWNRLLSITNLFDSSISYRIYTWKGTLDMIKDYLFSGIGFGNEAFANVYPFYAYSGMETATHSHSLFLQILVGTGIFGLLVFFIVMFLNFQKCFEYIKSTENKASRIYVSAAVSAAISALIMGAFDYIWYNYRVFYIFWIVIAIGCAFVRVGNQEAAYKKNELDVSEYT